MKKNLRIASVAAAALLAVAPVAASAVSTVSADAITSVTEVNKPVELPENDAKVNITPNVTLTTSVPKTDIEAALNASFTATVDGTTATSTFKPKISKATMWYYNEKGVRTPVKQVSDVTAALAGTLFKVQLHGVSLNFGTKNANKHITLVLPNENGNHFGDKAEDLTYKTKTDKNGVATISKDIILGVYAKNFADPTVVTWFNATTSAPVTAGNITLYAGSDAGKMNVDQVVAQARKNYLAKGAKVADPTNNIKEALKAMNVDVDNGWFVAPKSFTFNMTATSNVNDATATLPVTVTVPNGKDVTPATVPSQPKTIMHNAYFYDKDAKRVGTDKVTRYNTVTVSMNKTKFSNGIEYYEVIENGKATGKFINADNIDGTKRTLKHNAYVYKSSKKRANKLVLKKGEEVTTYGGTYTFKNGKQYYKIGNDTKKTYVKASNF